MPAREFVKPTDASYQAASTLDLMMERYRLAGSICEISKPRRVLDACCGTAWGARNLPACGASFVAGFDASEEALSHGQTSPHCLLIRANGVSVPLKAESFDGVFAFECIEHFSPGHARQFVAELRRVCGSAGWLVGSTPVCPTRGLLSVFREWNPYHLSPFVKHDLAALLAEYFSVVEIIEVYNFVEPYMVFVCVPTEEAAALHAQIVAAVEVYRLKQEIDAKAYSYCRWLLIALTSGRLQSFCELLLGVLKLDGFKSLVWIFKILARKVNRSLSGAVADAPGEP